MPDKSPDAFRTISEVADWLGVQPHVLRFWESKFSQVRPVKRAGGRRYYRPNDMLLLGGIRKLLHEDGLTIKGAQKVLREEGMAHVARMSQPLDPESAALSALHAEREADAAEEYGVAATVPEPQTGQVLNFGSAQHADAKRAPEPTDATAEPDAEMPADEVQPPPHLSDTPPARGGPEETAEPVEESDEPSPQESPLPSFMRSSSTRRMTEPEPASSQDSPPPPAPSDRLPSFLQKPPPEPAPPTPDETAPPSSSTDAPSGTDETGETFAPTFDAEASEPAAPRSPKPRVVQAPDPDESAIEVSSGALSACHSVTRLAAEQRAEVLPLLSRLAALRDRMASARGG